MIHIVQEIFERAITRLSLHLITFVPPLIVAVLILLSAFLLATAIRWLIVKAMKGVALDRFLRDSGLVSVVDRTGRLRAASVIAGVAFWMTLGLGFLTALDVFDTSLTSRIIESTVFAIPKLLTAAAILLAGFWLARYLGRSALVWAVNEGVSFARRLGLAVKLAVLFVTVVVAAETLGFAERVFFAAFVIVAGAAALTASIAAGLRLRSLMERSLERKAERSNGEFERSLWNYL
jgi:hypothetical protein